MSRGAANDRNLLLHVVDSLPQHCTGHILHHTQGQLKLSSLYVQFRLAGPSHTIKLSSNGCSLTASNNHNNSFLSLLGNPVFKSTSVPLPDFSSKFCRRRSQPSSPSGYRWLQADTWCLQSRITLKQVQKIVLFTYIWNNGPPCTCSVEPCIRLLFDTTTTRCYFLSAHLSVMWPT